VPAPERLLYAALHLLALGIGLAAVWSRGQALKGNLDSVANDYPDQVAHQVETGPATRYERRASDSEDKPSRSRINHTDGIYGNSHGSGNRRGFMVRVSGAYAIHVV
jgi:hypothetical protein